MLLPGGGFYEFTDLDPDMDYFVVFDITTLPAGYEFTMWMLPETKRLTLTLIQPMAACVSIREKIMTISMLVSPKSPLLWAIASGMMRMKTESRTLASLAWMALRFIYTNVVM